MNLYDLNPHFESLRNLDKWLFLVCIACAVIAITKCSPNSYEDALAELRAIKILSNSSYLGAALKNRPELLEYQPILAKCYQNGQSVCEYYSALTGIHFQGIGDTQNCIEYMKDFVLDGPPPTNRTSDWAAWLGGEFTNPKWMNRDESGFHMQPSLDYDSIQVIGTGQSWIVPTEVSVQGPSLFKGDMYDERLSVTSKLGEDWTYADVVEIQLSMPAAIGPTMYGPINWAKDEGLLEELTHTLGDSKTLFGGLRSIDLISDTLTIDESINRVQVLMPKDEDATIFGITVPGNLITIFGPVFILFLQCSILLHLRNLTKRGTEIRPEPDVSFPWIPLYDGVWSKVYNIAFLACLPALAILGILLSPISAGVITFILSLELCFSLWIGYRTIRSLDQIRPVAVKVGEDS